MVLSVEHPEANLRHVVRGIVRTGQEAVAPKASVLRRIVADLLNWFSAQVAGYQARTNATLRAYREAAR